MSQKSEKYARSLGYRVDKLELSMKQLRQAQVDSDRFTACLHAIRSQTEQDDAARRRKTREVIRSAKRWQRTAWLAIIAMMLCAALCLTMKIKADVVQPDIGITASETVKVKD